MDGKYRLSALVEKLHSNYTLIKNNKRKWRDARKERKKIGGKFGLHIAAWSAARNFENVFYLPSHTNSLTFWRGLNLTPPQSGHGVFKWGGRVGGTFLSGGGAEWGGGTCPPTQTYAPPHLKPLCFLVCVWVRLMWKSGGASGVPPPLLSAPALKNTMKVGGFYGIVLTQPLDDFDRVLPHRTEMFYGVSKNTKYNAPPHNFELPPEQK